MAETLSELLIRIGGKQDSSLDLAVKSTENKVKNMSQSISDISGKMSIGFGIATAGIFALGKNVVDTASKFEQYKIVLFSVTKSQAETNRLFEEAKTFAKLTPFNIQDVVRATVFIKALGLDVDRLRGLAVNLALSFDTDLQTAINAVGRAFKGSSEGYEVLRNQFGITGDEIAKFGGVVQKGNQIVVSNKEAVDANAKALEKIVNTKYGNALALQANSAKTAFSGFEDAVMILKNSIGEQLLPEMTKLVLKINVIITDFNKMDDSQKSLIAGLLKTAFAISAVGFALSGLTKIVVSSITGLSAMALFFKTNFVLLLSDGFAIFSKATGALLVSFSALSLAIAAVVIVAAVTYNEILKMQTKTSEMEAKMIQDDSKSLAAYFKFKRDGIVDMNNKQQIALAIQGAQLQKDQQSINLIKQMIKLKYEMGTSIWEDANASKNKADRQDYIDNLDAQIKKMENLNQLDKLSIPEKQKLLLLYQQNINILQQQGAGEKEVQKVRVKVKDIEKDIQKAYEETKQKHEEMIEKQLEGDVAYINHKKAMGEVSLKDEIAFYDRLLKTHELSNEDRLKVTRENQIRERELLQEKNKGDIQWLNNKKELNQVSLKEEIAFYDRFIKTHKISEEEKLKITQENNVRRRQLKKEEEDDNKKIVDKAKEVLTKRGDILGRFQDEYNSLTKSETELEIIEFNARLAEYKKVVTDEVKIREMIEKEKLKIVKDYTQKQKEAGEDVNQAEIKRLQSLVGQLEGERGQSPFMTAEEMSARNRLTMLGADFEKSPQASPPISSDVMAQVNKIGESPTNINNTNANTSNDRVYNINIAGISLSGDKAKGLGSMLANLVPLDAVNRAESTIISMA